MNHRHARLGTPDLLILLGVGALIYGTYLIFPPIAWVLGGLILLALGGVMVRRERRPSA